MVCLDAPLVAICWQWLFASSFHVAVSDPARAALFLTAWLIYLIDRLADSVSLKPSSEKSVRQEFCLRHTSIWVGLILVIALLDAAIVLAQLDRRLILWGAFLGGAAFLYLALNYALNRFWKTIPIKEIVIGFLFALGTLLVVAPELSSATSTSIVAALLFAALCSLNCMSIAVWERDLDWNQEKHSIATRWPSLDFLVRPSCFLLAAASLLVAAIDHVLLPLGVCLAISAILLAALHAMSIQRDARTALADLVLLAPAVLFCAEIVL